MEIYDIEPIKRLWIDNMFRIFKRIYKHRENRRTVTFNK